MNDQLENWNEKLNNLLNEAMESQIHPMEVFYSLKKLTLDLEYGIVKACWDGKGEPQ